MKVFQRTPGLGAAPARLPTPALAQALFARLPLAQQARAQRAVLGHEAAGHGARLGHPGDDRRSSSSAKLHLRPPVNDPWLRRQLTPDFRAGCKRMLMSSDYYPALQRRQLQADLLADRHHQPRRAPHQRRRRAPLRRDRLRHRLRRPPEGPPFQVIGPGRALAAGGVGRRAPRGVQERSACTATPTCSSPADPTPAPATTRCWSTSRARSTTPWPGVRDHPRPGPALSRRARGRPAALQRRDPAAAGPDDLDVGLPQLVPHRRRATTPSMYPGFATQYLRQMKSFRTRDYRLVGPRENAVREQQPQRTGVA